MCKSATAWCTFIMDLDILANFLGKITVQVLPAGIQSKNTALTYLLHFRFSKNCALCVSACKEGLWYSSKLARQKPSRGKTQVTQCID